MCLSGHMSMRLTRSATQLNRIKCFSNSNQDCKIWVSENSWILRPKLKKYIKFGRIFLKFPWIYETCWIWFLNIEFLVKKKFPILSWLTVHLHVYINLMLQHQTHIHSVLRAYAWQCFRMHLHIACKHLNTEYSTKKKTKTKRGNEA